MKKRKKLSFYNSISIALTLALFLTLGAHTVKEKSQTDEVEIEIILKAEKISGDPCDEKNLSADGKYPVLVTGHQGGDYCLLCRGRVTEAGFLLCGAKYISANQPLNIYGERSGIEGRVLFADFRASKDKQQKTVS